jgi:TrmH family RNA methyltransferase
MIPKAKIKFVKSLQLKKYRIQEQCFVVEGEKSVIELLNSDFEIIFVAGTQTFMSANESLMAKQRCDFFEANEDELVSMGSFQSNQSALAIAKMKPNVIPKVKNEFCLALDDIKDPGNLGTIIRTADWYGIRNIFASAESADFYNSKTISATMGSFCRVLFSYVDLTSWIKQCGLPVFAAFLDGEDVHQTDFGTGGVILIGSESHGIRNELFPIIHKRITIPRVGKAESLNAAIATGIILDNLVRSKK